MFYNGDHGLKATNCSHGYGPGIGIIPHSTTYKCSCMDSTSHTNYTSVNIDHTAKIVPKSLLMLLSVLLMGEPGATEGVDDTSRRFEQHS